MTARRGERSDIIPPETPRVLDAKSVGSVMKKPYINLVPVSDCLNYCVNDSDSE